MIKSKKQMFSIISIFTLLLFLGTITYAFFNYTRTGVANTISVGRISFTTGQTETISLTNVFPIDSSDIDTDTDNVDELVITIEGDTDYGEGIEYLISTTDTNVYINGKTIPISIDVDIDGLGTSNDNYFTARNSKNANIYKRLSGDEVVSNQMLLVGYIKPNTTSGQAEGIDGSITIKTYLDKDKIAISDTYDGLESDNMGTTSEWVDDRVVLTTTEWNALQSNGMSFKVRIEANEGIWVNEPLYQTLLASAVMDNIHSTNVTSITGIDFSKISGDTDNDNVIDNGEGLYIRSITANDAYPIVYYRGAVEDNNVYFAGKCWQIIRTTDTGGIKMIYNGENTGTSDEPACEPANGVDRQITLNVEGEDTNTFAYNIYSDAIAYVGYMYGNDYRITREYSGSLPEGTIFGNSFEYSELNGKYSLVDTKVGIDENHHYTCALTDSEGSCDTIRYYTTYEISNGSNTISYYSLNNGKSIEDTIEDMLENDNNSNAKEKVDKWYEQNLKNTSYSNQLEDTIYCNDRHIIRYNKLNPNGGSINASSSMDIVYAAQKKMYVMHRPTLKCMNKESSFTHTPERGNGDLDYSIGLITDEELMMAGGKMGINNVNYYLNTGAMYYTMSPLDNTGTGQSIIIGVTNQGSLVSVGVQVSFGLRPVISLKQGTSIEGGEGTSTNPYVVS